MARPMKDSGVQWIGSIPSEWTIERNKNLFRCSKEIVGTESANIQLLSLTTRGVKKKSIDDVGGKIPESYDTYQIVSENNLIMCLFDLDCSAVFSGLSPYNGMISPAYKVLSCTSIASPSFYNYWFMYVADGRKFNHYAKNLRFTLNYDEFATLPAICPSVKEQQRIANFLDDKCAAIDDVVTKTQESIEEYKKLKQAMITEAVTKGVRGKRPMKDSCIEWIGQIPENWIVKRFRYIANSFEKGIGITKDEVFVDGDTPCVRYGEIYSKYNQSFLECFSKTKKDVLPNLQYFSNGDILFTCTGELIEEIGKSVVYLGKERCLAGGDIIVVKHHQNPSFLNYALNSSYLQTQKSCGKTKLKVVHISAQELKDLVVFLPSLNEQKEIADYLDKKCAAIDSLIEKKQQFIEELTAYKKSLIYEYVTGKKEVPA